MKAHAPLIVLLDEGAPRAVAEPFSKNGHTVIHHSDVLASGSKDQLVAYSAIQNKAVLIAVDRDMKQLAKRFGNPNEGGRFKNLHLISISCNEVMAAKRIEQAMSLIEHEWTFTCLKPSRRFWVDIGPHHLRTNR